MKRRGKRRRYQAHPPKEIVGLSEKYMRQLKEQMDFCDSLSDEEVALVHEYGYGRALEAIRRFYGRPHMARQYLEAERQRLQVARWENIPARSVNK